jgi:ABC-type multidrug transport system fused ATPase/permease subunit
MLSWFDYLQAALNKKESQDQTPQQKAIDALKDAWVVFKPIMRSHWKSGLVGFGLVFFASLLAFISPLVQRFLIDDVIIARRLDLLAWALLLFVGLKILNMGSSLLEQYHLLNFQESVLQDLQESLLDHVLQLPKSFFDKKEIGFLISRISSDLQGLNWFFSGTLAYLLTNIVQFFGGLGFLFLLEWRLASASLILLPILLVTVQFFSKRIRVLSHQGMEQHAQVTRHLQETISAIPLVKAFASEEQERKRVMDAYQERRQTTMESSVLRSVASLAIQTTPDLANGLVLILGGYLIIQGEWTLGSLMAFLSYLGLVFGPARYFADTNFSLQYSLAALQRVMNLFDTVPEENLQTGTQVDRLQGDIVFDMVSFSYASSEPVLEDISFHIRPGEHVAIVGPSGVGKTTLISLILAFYKPGQGKILFDGQPISFYHLPSLRKRIGYVSQSTLLLSGTFNENLRYGNPHATQAEVEAAAQAAGIHPYIIGLPDRYESRIDERAVNLSEGQKQRLSIARALIKQPDIFILDEPTSALDNIIEQAIFEALPPYVQDKTLFIVAHRLATIQASDRILLLNEKQFMGMGTHAQLLASSAYYQQLVTNQIAAIKTDPKNLET